MEVIQWLGTLTWWQLILLVAVAYKACEVLLGFVIVVGIFLAAIVSIPFAFVWKFFSD